MKLKYKGIILMITMGTMCIGMVTFSIHTPSVKSGAPVSESNPVLPTAEPSAVPEASSAPLSPASFREWVDHPEITGLVGKYYTAQVQCDMEALKGLVTDTAYVDESMLKVKQNYEEEYRNIECYILPGPKEGDYLVYSYFELKFLSIDTPAPGLNFLYVTQAGDGTPRIFRGVLDDATEAYIEKAQSCSLVVSLMKSVETKLSEALASDPKLKEFYDNINNTITKDSEEE